MGEVEGVYCPECGSDDISFIPDQLFEEFFAQDYDGELVSGQFKCNECGEIFE